MKARSIVWGHIEGYTSPSRPGFVGGRECFRLLYKSTESPCGVRIFAEDYLNGFLILMYEGFDGEDEAKAACESLLEEQVDYLQRLLICLTEEEQRLLICLTEEETNDNNSN